MSPHIYPANRIRSDRRPRRIRCHKMCSVDSSLWCWGATTQAAGDDALSQRQGWRGVLSFSFKVGVCQGRATLSCKSLRGVCAPNRLTGALAIARSRGSGTILGSVLPSAVNAITISFLIVLMILMKDGYLEI